MSLSKFGSEGGTPVADDLYPKFAAGSLTWGQNQQPVSFDPVKQEKLESNRNRETKYIKLHTIVAVLYV